MNENIIKKFFDNILLDDSNYCWPWHGQTWQHVKENI